MGNAARSVLESMNQKPNQPDPVKQLAENNYFSERFLILNLAGAFESVADSEGQAAQELAEQYRSAVDDYYKK